MSSPNTKQPLELDAVMRSIRPAVKTPEATARTEQQTSAAPAVVPSNAPAAMAASAVDVVPATVAAEPAPKIDAAAARRPRKAERDDHRVQIDVVPALGEATVGVYLRLPKSIHQQLKTVVFQNELTEQGLRSIADISREAIGDWLAKHRQRTQAA